MAIFKRVAAVLLIGGILLGAVGCAASPAPSDLSGSPSFFGEETSRLSSPEKLLKSPDGADGVPDANETQISAGQITAGAHNDNLSYDEWNKLFFHGQGDDSDGKFYVFANKGWQIDAKNRITVTVTKGGQPVAGASVVAKNGDKTEFKAMSDAQGKAYLFPACDAGTVVVRSGGYTAEATFDAQARDLVLTLDGADEKADLIELMFVVDVTGSMGDELSFLKAELGDVIRRVATDNTAAHVRLSFLFYRDDGDDEKFAFADFADVTDPVNYTKQSAILARQSATGGGDYEEAVDEALETAVGKQWSDNATKMIFLLLDAPAHHTDRNKTTFSGAVRTAAAKGIRICPVLASSADLLCEYLTRSAAILTGGTFCFITDDSGIGGEHHDPKIPDVTVEYLNDLMVRLINGYHTGTFADPVPISGTPSEADVPSPNAPKAE